MSFYTAINYWILGGFAGEKSARDAIKDAKEMGLGLELTFGDCLKPDITQAECEDLAVFARDMGVGLRTLATGNYWGVSLGADDERERAAAIKFTEKYLQVAAWLGAGAVLVVPGAVQVAWDPSRPVVPYQTVWEKSAASLRGLLPLAEELGIDICLENVWNKFLLSPMEFKLYVEQFASRRLGVYLDLGNAMLNGFPEHWVELLGNKVKAVHAKNFKGADCAGGLHGFGDDLLAGDVDFPAVFAALGRIGYAGPVTAEMIPFSRLPDLVLPDMDLARKTAGQLRTLFG